jgi:hypothetical protein
MAPIHKGKAPTIAHYRFLFKNKGLQVDWLGLAENHLDTQKNMSDLWSTGPCVDKHNAFKCTTCVFSQSDLIYDGNIKLGRGVLQLATDNLASRTTISSHSEKYANKATGPARLISEKRVRSSPPYLRIGLPQAAMVPPQPTHNNGQCW